MSDKEIISELEDALAMAEATIKESRDAQRRLGNSVATLRAELERVTDERDALAHWRQKYHELAAENTRLESERDAARQSARAWKRSAKMWRRFSVMGLAAYWAEYHMARGVLDD